jgi:lysophospholipase L1-like esterase
MSPVTGRRRAESGSDPVIESSSIEIGQGGSARVRDEAGGTGIVALIAFVGGVLVTAGVIGLVAALGYAHWIAPASQADPPENPFPTSAHDVVVLGDSFASGEGARGFWSDSGNCHRSWQTYAYMIANLYKDGLIFPACSGAVIDDLEKANGSIPAQLSALQGGTKPVAVLVQVSGNDAGFGDLVLNCLKATYDLTSTPCADDDFLARLPAVEPRLVQLYRMVKDGAKGAPVFVMGYPDPFGPTYCTASELTPTDFTYVSTDFIPTLDGMVQTAAQAAGVHYVDLLHAFSGFGVCQLPVGEAAINTISYLSLLARHDSFHPSAIGQLLMAVQIESVLRDYGLPPPEETVSSQDYKELTGKAAPAATVPSQSAVANPAPDTSPCHAGTPQTTTYPLPKSSAAVAVSGVAANSTVCYRVNGGSWQEINATAQGGLFLGVPSDPGSKIEIVLKDKLGSWSREIYVRSSK